jgi:peroxiredoxin
MLKGIMAALVAAGMFALVAGATEPSAQQLSSPVNFSSEESSVAIGSEAPGLELTTLDGKNVNLQKYFGARPTILAFLASWSKSCQVEFSDLQKLYAGQSVSLEVLAVSFDKKNKDLKAYLAKNEITFPVLLDKKLSALDRFKIIIIPTTFCVNRKGVVEKIFVDYDENVKKALLEWLKS